MTALDPRCEDCAHFLKPGGRMEDGRHYLVACCRHPEVANQWGIYAVSLARRWDEWCGVSGRGFQRRQP